MVVNYEEMVVNYEEMVVNYEEMVVNYEENYRLLIYCFCGTLYEAKFDTSSIFYILSTKI
jgi:hypothetical protein